MRTVFSAFALSRLFADPCGWDVPDSKGPPPTKCFRALGAMLEFSGFPRSPMLIKRAVGRVEALTLQLRDVLESQRLTPAFAGKIFGKIGF